jgi:AraC-like DNA-binding protein
MPPAGILGKGKMQELEAGYHYKVIARAIEVIDAEGPGVRLDDLAARMGMSAAHFQRVFSAWAGVSPKRYQQYLALGLARELLQSRATVLEAAEGAGLGAVRSQVHSRAAPPLCRRHCDLAFAQLPGGADSDAVSARCEATTRRSRG